MSVTEGSFGGDPTDFTQPPPPDTSVGSDFTSSDNRPDQTTQPDPTDFTHSAAAFDNASDNTFGTDNNRKSYQSDPTDFTQSSKPFEAPSDVQASDQSNVNQAAGDITAPAKDPTDFTAPSQPEENRGERSASLSTPQFTPEESGRAANAESGYFSTEDQQQQAAASFKGEQDNLNQRWQDYVDAVNGGTQERDPTFEASIQGEQRDLEDRRNAWQGQAQGYLRDAAGNAANVRQDIAQEQQFQAGSQIGADLLLGTNPYASMNQGEIAGQIGADLLPGGLNPPQRIIDTYNPDNRPGWRQALDAANTWSEQNLGGSLWPDFQWNPGQGVMSNLGYNVGQVLQPEVEMYNRLAAQGAVNFHNLQDPNNLANSPNPNLGTGGPWYVLTGNQAPGQTDLNYKTAQFLANNEGALASVLPGSGGGGTAGIYDVPVVGGVARMGKAVWDMGDTGGPQINIGQLEQDIASGNYTDAELQKKYPGNEAYKIIQETLNPINYVEIPGVGEVVEKVLTAPTSRAIDELGARVRTAGWDGTATKTADDLLTTSSPVRGKIGLDTSGLSKANALTDIRTDALVTNVSTAEKTIAGLYDGAAKLAQYDALGRGVGTDALRTAALNDARQVAAELSRLNTGGFGQTENYLDAMETIRQGATNDITARARTNATLETAQQIASGTAKSAAEVAPKGETDVAKVLSDKAKALGQGQVPVKDLIQAAQSRGIDVRTMNPEEAQWARAEAMKSMLASDLRAAYYGKAGVALPGTESALHKGLAGTFNAVRGLLLMAAAPPLALQKFSDEWVRALIGGGVVSVRPADMAIAQAGARNIAQRNLFGMGERAQSFLDRGTIRNAAIRNDVLPPMSLQPRTTVGPYGFQNAFSGVNRYGEKMGLGDRAAALGLAPFRGINKFNDMLIGAPTQHVLLNAFYKDTKTLDRTRTAIAEKAYQDILRAGFDPEEAQIARDRLMTATTQRDFVRIGTDIQNSTGVRVNTAPGVPEAGRAMGTATPTPTQNARVNENIAATGGAPGQVRSILDSAQGTRLPLTRVDEQGNLRAPLPQDIAPEKYAGIKEEPPITSQAAAGQRAKEWVDAISKSEGVPGFVPNSVQKSAEELGLKYNNEPPQVFAEMIRRAGGGSAGMGTFDQAAGGAGIVSQRFNAARGNEPLRFGPQDLPGRTPLASNQVGEMNLGGTRGYPKGSLPGQNGRRLGVTDELIKAWTDGRVNPENVIANARTALADARASGNVPRQHQIEDWLLDHGQAASVAKDKAAHDLLNAARQEMFGPSTVSPATRAIRRGDELAAFRTTPEPPAVVQRVRQMQQERGLSPIEPNAPRVPGRDAYFTPVQPEAEDIALGRAAQAARANPDPTDFTQPAFNPVQRGAFTPQEQIGPSADLMTGATSELPRYLTPPRDVNQLAAMRQQAGQAVIGRGAELAQAQREAVGAGIQRGYNIIGNQRDQTTLGGWMKNGIGGVTPPVLPFAPFHIHSAQFWAREFAQRPGLAVAVANALSNLDDYGTLHLPGGQTVSGLIKLLTGAHILDWVNKAVEYHQAVAAQGNNNLLQRIGKDIAYNTVGNNAFVRPFEYVSDPALAFAQQHTNPLYKLGKNGQPERNPETGELILDSRDAYKTSGTQAGLTGLANTINDNTGQHIPRGVIGAVTNPGQAIGNAARTGMSNLTGSRLQQYTDDTAFAYWLGDYAQKQGYDPKFVQQAVYNPKNANDTAFAAQLRDTFQRQQDQKAIGKLAPVQVGRESTAKGIFRPTQFNDNSQSFFNQRNFAGEGGKDAGIRLPDNKGGYYIPGAPATDNKGGYYLETPQRASYTTARSQLELPPSLSTAPTADYARHFLEGTGYIPPASASLRDNAGTSAYFDARQNALTGQIAGNTSRFGATLPQDQRAQYLSAVGTELAPGFTVNDLINQPGNVKDLIRQYEQAKAGGATKEQLKAISDRINYAQQQDISQFPQTQAYFDQQDALKGYVKGEPPGYASWSQNQKDAWDAFNDLRNTPEYKEHSTLSAQAHDIAAKKGTKEYTDWWRTNGDRLNQLDNIVNGAEQSIVDRFGINPRELANKIATDAGRAPTYPTTEIGGQRPVSPVSPSPSSTTRSGGSKTTYSTGSRTNPRTSSGSRYGGGSGTTSSASRTGTSSANQAANNFFDFYRTLIQSADKATVLDALDKAGVNPIGKQGVSAAMYERALQVAKDALDQRNKAQGRGTPFTYEFYQPTAQDVAMLQRGISPDRGTGLPGNRTAQTAQTAQTTTTARTSGLPGNRYPTSKKKAA